MVSAISVLALNDIGNSIGIGLKCGIVYFSFEDHLEFFGSKATFSFEITLQDFGNI